MKTNDFICNKEQSVENCYGCKHIEFDHEKRTFDCKCQRPVSFHALKLTNEAKKVMFYALKTEFIPHWGVDCLYSFFIKSGYELGANCEKCEAAKAFLTFQETGKWLDNREKDDENTQIH